MLLRWLFDSPEAWQVGFQDSASQGLTGITDLHNSIFFFLILILLGVFWALFAIICAFNSKKTGFVNYKRTEAASVNKKHQPYYYLKG